MKLFLEQEQHYDTFDTNADVGPKTEDTVLSTFDANQKAVEALRILLRKLPNKLTLPTDNLNEIELNDNNDDDDNNNLPDKTFSPHNIKQYGIPNDPTSVQIPNFRPIKSLTSTYTFQLGPFESVTKHTIGGPDSDEHISISSGPKTKILSNNPHSNLALHANHLTLVPPHPIKSTSFRDVPPSLDLYHSMTLKNHLKPIHPNYSNKNNNFHQNINDHTNHLQPPQTVVYLPPQSPQLHSSPQFEIQKSIQYQIQ